MYESTISGASGTDEFIHTIFAVLEAIAQHPAILTEYHGLVIEKILPSLAALVSSQSGMNHHGTTRDIYYYMYTTRISLFS